MSIKTNWGRILLGGASLAALATPAFAQDAAVSDEIVVTATGRAAAIQDVPLAVTALGAEALENAGVADLTDIDQLVPSFRIYAGQSTTAGTVARIRGVATGSDNPGFESAVGVFVDGVYRARPGLALGDLPELERVEILRGPQGTLFGRNTTAGAISIITAGPDFTRGAWGEVGIGDLGYKSVRVGGTTPIVEDHLAARADFSYRQRDGFIEDITSGKDINTVDRWSGRLQFQFDMANDASWRIIIDGGSTDEVCCGAVPLAYGAGPAAVINGVVGPSALPTPNPEARRMTVTPGRDYSESTDEFGISGQFDGSLFGARFTSITSMRDWEANRNQDVDFNAVDIAYRDGLEIRFDTWTQEFRLQGEAGRLDWLVGVFYGNEELETTDRIRIGAHSNAYINGLIQALTLAQPGGPYEIYDTQPGACLDTQPATCDTVRSLFYFASSFNAALANAYLAPNAAGQGQQSDRWNQDTQTMAIFTHNELALSDNLTLTIGARYNREVKQLYASLNSTSTTCDSLRATEIATDPAIPGPGGIVTALLPSPLAGAMTLACNPAINPIANGGYYDENHYTEWSGIASLSYDFTDDAMGYVSYSHGFKGGGWNLDRSGFSALTPATTNQGTLNATQLRFNPETVDAYEVGLKTTWGRLTFNIDYFLQQLSDYQLNAFSGFNFITRNVPEGVSKGVEVDFAWQLTDSFSWQGGVVWNDAYYDSAVDFTPATPLTADINPGRPFAQAPELSITSAFSWEHQIGPWMGSAYLDMRYNSDYETQTLSRDPLGRTDQDAYMLVNGRVGLGALDDRWSLELWGRNLTDEFYFVGAFEATLQPGTYLIYPNEPRTWGVTLKARY